MNKVTKLIQERTSNNNILNKEIDNEVINEIILCGMSANDYGGLKPWQIQVFIGEGRNVLDNAFKRHDRNPGNQRTFDSSISKAFRSPVVMCVSTKYQDSKIPKEDQKQSGSAVCQLITLASHSLGLSAKWRTGEYSQSHLVKDELNINDNNEILGFIYIGYPKEITIKKRTYDFQNVKYITRKT